MSSALPTYDELIKSPELLPQARDMLVDCALMIDDARMHRLGTDVATLDKIKDAEHLVQENGGLISILANEVRRLRELVSANEAGRQGTSQSPTSS